MSVPDWMIDAPQASVDDLAALVRRLARSLRKAAPDNDLPDQALDYLRRHGLTGEILRATLAAGSQAVQVPGWRPIETAPRGANGVAWFLLAWGPEGDQSTGVGMRIGEKFFAAGIFYRLGQEKAYEFREVEVQPTHWMPLPAAPLQPLAGGEVAK